MYLRGSVASALIPIFSPCIEQALFTVNFEFTDKIPIPLSSGGKNVEFNQLEAENCIPDAAFADTKLKFLVVVQPHLD